MALSQASVWEIRPGAGADTNGGNFVTGATGTDYSKQNAAQYALTGLTSAGAGATLLSAAAATDMVGNGANVVSGTNVTAGYYQVISVVAGVSITFDRSVATGVAASVVLNIGGALATISAAATNIVIQNTVYVKATGTYTYTSAIALASLTSKSSPISFIGYTTTRGDGGRVTLTTATNTTNFLTANSTSGLYFANFAASNTASTRAAFYRAVSNEALGVMFENCAFDGFNVALDFGNVSGGNDTVYTFVVNCEVKNSTVRGIYITGAAHILGCYVHDNTGPGLELQSSGSSQSENGPTTIQNSVFYNNTGAGVKSANDASFGSGTRYIVMNNSACVNNGAEGLLVSGTVNSNQLMIWNNIFYGNTTYGVSVGSWPDTLGFNRNNAYGANGTAARLNLTAGTGDVTLSGDPFTARTGADFSLNNTAGAGAACRGVGYPGVLTIGGTGYPDIGPLQSQASAGSSGMLYVPSLEGV